MRSYKEIYLAAVDQNGYALEYVPHQSKEIYLATNNAINNCMIEPDMVELYRRNIFALKSMIVSNEVIQAISEPNTCNICTDDTM